MLVIKILFTLTQMTYSCWNISEMIVKCLSIYTKVKIQLNIIIYKPLYVSKIVLRSVASILI